MKYNSQNNQPSSSRAASRQEAAAAAAEARKSYEARIGALARKVERFRIDGQRFFAGDLKLPPDELRGQITTELRRLQSSKLATAADSFRLGSIEAQYNSHVELFGRRLRASEQGVGGRRSAPPKPYHDPRKGVVFGRDGAVEALYKELYLRRGKGKPKMDLERFRSHLHKQAEAIRTKTGCAEIQFRIAEEGNKMKIKAKPIKKAGA